MRVLLSGQMRSGTTFLNNVLNAQPGVTMYGDFLHIARLKAEAQVHTLTDPLSLAQKYAVVGRFYSKGDGCGAIVGSTGAQLELRLTPFDFNTLVEFYNLVFEHLRSPESKVIGHKTTAAEDIVEEMLEVFPDLKCLYIVRDPRDVVLSNRRMMGQESALVLEDWRIGVQTMLALQQHDRLGRRVCLVRYEDLMVKPEDTLAQIAEFLELGGYVMPDQLDWYGQDYVANSSFNDIQRLFDTSGIGRWKQEEEWLPALAELIVHNEMIASGYETEALTWSPKMRRSLRWWKHLRPTIRRWFDLPNIIPNYLDRVMEPRVYPSTLIDSLEKYL